MELSKYEINKLRKLIKEHVNAQVILSSVDTTVNPQLVTDAATARNTLYAHIRWIQRIASMTA